jgi:plastocyanin
MRFRFVFSMAFGLAAAVGVVVGPAYAQDPTPHRLIFALDACDPATFNQALGPGTCTRPGGGVPLNQFLNQVQTLHFAPAWRFIPSTVTATTEDPIEVKNIGGELHTFTEVAQFGGGIVPLLNQLDGNLTERPECAAPPNDDNHFLQPGASFVFTEEDAGVHLYQCCIHPWMHETLTIRPARGGLAVMP